MRSLQEIADDIHYTSTNKGFDPPDEWNMDQKLLLAVSEICEAQEELRSGHNILAIYYKSNLDNSPIYFHAGNGGPYDFPEGHKPEGFIVEVADAIIRLLHIAASLNIDIEKVIELKVAYNKTRPIKHGRQF